VIDIHEKGMLSRVYDIEERELADLSRAAYGDAYAERYGSPEDRDFWWPWS
jgi:hypothetical protein